MSERFRSRDSRKEPWARLCFELMLLLPAIFAASAPVSADSLWGPSEPTTEWGAPVPGSGTPSTGISPARDRSTPSSATQPGSAPPLASPYRSAGPQFAPPRSVERPAAINNWAAGNLSGTSSYAPVAIPDLSNLNASEDLSSILLPLPLAGTVLPPQRGDVPQPARDAVLPPPLETNSKQSLAWRNVAYSLLQQQPGRNLLIRNFKASYKQTMASLAEQAQAEGWVVKGQSIAAGHLLLEVPSHSSGGNEGAFIFALSPTSDGATEVRLRVGDSKRAQDLANSFLIRAEERAMRMGAPIT